jgi:hypothetical protein
MCIFYYMKCTKIYIITKNAKLLKIAKNRIIKLNRRTVINSIRIHIWSDLIYLVSIKCCNIYFIRFLIHLNGFKYQYKTLHWSLYHNYSIWHIRGLWNIVNYALMFMVSKRKTFVKVCSSIGAQLSENTF